MDDVDSRMKVLLPPATGGTQIQPTCLAKRDIGICVLAEDGAIIDLNERAAALMEIPRRRAVGMQFGDAFCCANSILRGCGNGVNCRHCPLRKNIEAAILHDDFQGDFTVAMESRNRAAPLWLKIYVTQGYLAHHKRIIVTMLDLATHDIAALEEAITRLGSNPQNYLAQVTDFFGLSLSA